MTEHRRKFIKAKVEQADRTLSLGYAGSDRGAWTQTVEVLAIVLIVLATGARFVGLSHTPLWIDETFTGAIASQPTFDSFVQLAHFDAPPSFLYYLIMHVWQMVFGLSDVALRAPSLGFSAAAPLVIAFASVPGLARAERLTWAAMLALWIPGIGFAQDARAYGFLLLMATIQTLMFYRLMAAPSLRKAVYWVLAADFTIAASYDAAYLAVAQGLIFLAVRRGRALRTWPAALLTVPVFAEIAWKWPILVRFAAVGVWYPLLHPINLLQACLYSLGGVNAGSLIWLLLFPPFVVGIFLLGRRRTAIQTDNRVCYLFWVAGASILGGAAMLAMGFLRPNFTWRYMLPLEPGTLLGLVLLMRTLGRDAKQTAYIGLMVINMIAYGSWLYTGADHWDSVNSPLNIEQGSQSLIQTGTRRVVFAWDNPTAQVMPPQLLSAVGGFFFRRENISIEVIPVQIGPKDDPNVRLLEAAAPSGASIIWLYDLSVRGTAAIKYSPRIAQIDPRYSCQNFGEGLIGSIACRPVKHPYGAGAVTTAPN